MYGNDDLHIAVHRKKYSNKNSLLWMIMDTSIMTILFIVAVQGEEMMSELFVCGLVLVSHILLKAHVNKTDTRLNQLYNDRLASGAYNLGWRNGLEESWPQKFDKSFFKEYINGIKPFTLFHLVVLAATFYFAFSKRGLIIASVLGILTMLMIIIDYKVFYNFLFESFSNHDYRKPR